MLRLIFTAILSLIAFSIVFIFISADNKKNKKKYNISDEAKNIAEIVNFNHKQNKN